MVIYNKYWILCNEYQKKRNGQQVKEIRIINNVKFIIVTGKWKIFPIVAKFPNDLKRFKMVPNDPKWS